MADQQQVQVARGVGKDAPRSTLERAGRAARVARAARDARAVRAAKAVATTKRPTT